MYFNNILQNLHHPFIHLVISDEIIFNSYISTQGKNLEKDIIVKMIKGENCTKIKDVFREFCIGFKFPNYFGNNWNAFDECINDLDWLEADGYAIIISDIDMVLLNDNENFESLVTILSNAAREWANGRGYDDFPTQPKPFNIIMQCNTDKETVMISRTELSGICEFIKL